MQDYEYQLVQFFAKTIIETTRHTKLLGFYQTEEGIWPDFADIRHDHTRGFTGPTHLLSANV